MSKWKLNKRCFTVELGLFGWMSLKDPCTKFCAIDLSMHFMINHIPNQLAKNVTNNPTPTTTSIVLIYLSAFLLIMNWEQKFDYYVQFCFLSAVSDVLSLSNWDPPVFVSVTSEFTSQKQGSLSSTLF